MTTASDILGRRLSGVLLHPTSLPGAGPIGALGSAAADFVDLLAGANQHIWQMLPLGPTPPDGSPYRALSAMAGNTWLLSERQLVRDGLLEADLPGGSPGVPDRVDFAAAAARADEIVRGAYAEYRYQGRAQTGRQFTAFREREADWLEDYTLFAALRRRFDGRAWVDWPDDLSSRDPAALQRARRDLAQEIEVAAYGQFLFQLQWDRLKAHAAERGIWLVGDIPIYVDFDSVDVWAHQSLFELDETGRPVAVAGVPPDYFSATGQRWGNPLYRWERMAELDYGWWTRRFERAFELVDVVRIDHFRGFEAYWRIPAHEPTAVHGDWVPGPGAAFFHAVERKIGRLPIIAEDLGLITDEVRALRDELGFPGMVILQFAFNGDPNHPYLPENYREESVVYPGTHDNDTTVGWYAGLSEGERQHVRDYLGGEPEDPAWAFIELGWRSRANLAVTTLQDVLSLGTEARMNVPGQAGGNWSWRHVPTGTEDERAARLADLTAETGRA